MYRYDLDRDLDRGQVPYVFNRPLRSVSTILLLQIQKNINGYKKHWLCSSFQSLPLKKEQKLVQNETVLNFRFISGCSLRVLNPIIRMECSEHIYTNRLGNVLGQGSKKKPESQSQEDEKFLAKFLENFVARSLNFASPTEFSLNTRT